MSNFIEPIHILYYENNIIRTNEQHVVADNKIVLNEIPDRFFDVRIDNMINVKDGQIINETDYKVQSFGVGLLEFHPSQNGKTINITEYYAKGVLSYPASRIYTEIDGAGKIVSTLGDVIKDNTALVQEIKDAIEEVKDLSEHHITSIVTDKGIHDMRYYNNKLEIYVNGTWNDILTDVNLNITNLQNSLVNLGVSTNTGLTNLQNNLESQIGSTNSRVNTNTTDIGNLTTKVNNNTTNINNNTTSISDLNDDYIQFKSDYDADKSNIDNSLSLIEDDLITKQSSINIIDGKVNANTTAINNNIASTNSNTTEITNIKANLTTIQTDLETQITSVNDDLTSTIEENKLDAEFNLTDAIGIVNDNMVDVVEQIDNHKKESVISGIHGFKYNPTNNKFSYYDEGFLTWIDITLSSGSGGATSEEITALDTKFTTLIQSTKDMLDTHKETSVANMIGTHSFRYYNNKLQYFENSVWVDINIGGSEGTIPTDIQDQLDDITGELATISSNVGLLQTDNNNNKTDITAIKSNIIALQSVDQSINTSIGIIENDIETISGQVSTSNTTITTIQQKINTVETGANKTVIDSVKSTSETTVPSSNLLKKQIDRLDIIETTRPIIKMKQGVFTSGELNEGEIGFEY